MPVRIAKPQDDLFGKTITNANRLLEDSKLLTANQRPRSAIILGVFALEELGKALITHWGVKNIASKRDYPTHVEKQTATFALLSANELLTSNPDKVRRHLSKGTLDTLKIGPYSHQFSWARAGFYDDLRMSATYDDKDPKIPKDLMDQVDCELAIELHGYFSRALSAVKNAHAMKLAAEIYSNGLGKL